MDGYPAIPLAVVTAFDGLPIFQALRCGIGGCNTYRTNHASLRSHYSKKHPDVPHPRYDHRTAVTFPVQQFTEVAGADRRFFAVRPRKAGPPLPVHPALQLADELEHRNRLEHSHSDPAQSQSPLIRSQKWNLFVQGDEPETLVSLARAHKLLPRTLKRAVHQLFKECEAILDLEIDDHIRQRLVTDDPKTCAPFSLSLSLRAQSLKLSIPAHSQPLSKHRLKVFQNHDTLDRYENVVVGLLGYAIRCCQAEDSPKHPPVTFECDDHDFPLQAIARTIEYGEVTAAIVDSIGAVLEVLWTTVWPPPGGGYIYDPTMRFIVISQLYPDGSWKELGSLSAMLSHVRYCILLIGVRKIHRESGSNVRGVYGNVEAAATRSRNQFKAYEDNMFWLHVHTPSTYNSSRTLVSLVASIILSSPPLPSICWGQGKNFTEFRIDGQPITIHEIRRSVQELTEGACDLVQNELFLGSREARVPYTTIHDDLSNSSNGYAIEVDELNPQFHDRKRLLKIVLADPALSAKIVSNATPDGHIIWNVNGCRKWLQSYHLWCQYKITAHTFAFSGSVRIPEIAHTTIRNTVSQNTRNYFVYDGVLIHVTTYTKQSSITGKDLFVCRAVPSVWADLIIQDHVVLRPFAELLASIVFPNDEDVRRLYHVKAFPNYDTLFTSDDVSPLLKSHIWRYSEAKLGVAKSRQVNAALRRHWCSQGQDDTHETADGDYIDLASHLMGHSEFTDRHHYGISAANMLSATEEEIPKMIEHAAQWQMAIGLVPGTRAPPPSHSHLT